jgi:hypothetical protein
MSTTTNARFRAAHDRLPVQDHHVEGDADRGGQAVDDHADAVADEEKIALARPAAHAMGAV